MRFNGFCIATFVLLAVTCAIPMAAHAYVGPGAGITFIGSLWGLVAVVGLAVVGILLWPFRSLLRRIKHRRQDTLKHTPGVDRDQNPEN